MIWCRVVLTILFLIIFPFYVTFNVVVQPLESKALMTVRESRSIALPPDFKDVKNARWNVVIVSTTYTFNNFDLDFVVLQTNFPDIPFDSPGMVQEALKAITVAKLIDNIRTRLSFFMRIILDTPALYLIQQLMYVTTALISNLPRFLITFPSTVCPQRQKKSRNWGDQELLPQLSIS